MKKAFAGLLLAVCLLTACNKEEKPEVITEDPQLAVSTTAVTEVLTESTEAETTNTEEPSTTAPETSEVATEATTEPTQPPTVETTATETEAATEKETQPTTAPTEATAPPTTTPSTTTPPTTEAPTEPPATETTAPTETQPPETEPPTTETPKEVIDIATLEAYGRAYAETLGYWGNPETGFSTNAGYFPPVYCFIYTMEEGRELVREMVDTQYLNDISCGHDIVVEIDGVEHHRQLNIYIESTDTPYWYLVYCFYGGD